jgi:hypothetical protein
MRFCTASTRVSTVGDGLRIMEIDLITSGHQSVGMVNAHPR